MQTYYFGDAKAQEALLRAHAADIAALNIARTAKGMAPLPFDLDRAIRLMRARVDRFYNGTSRHFPHQGENEMARRAQR